MITIVLYEVTLKPITTQLLFVMILSSLGLMSTAQIRISGTVEDSTTGQKLEHTTVIDASTKAGVSTDQNGDFVIDVPSLPTTLLFYHVGYIQRQIHIESQTEVAVKLQEDPDLLNLVVVSGNKGEKRLKELTMSLETIRPDIVEDKNPVIMDEVINQIPGVQVTDDQVSIRAGSGWSYGAGSRVTLLMDGMPLMNGDAGNILWTFISSDQVGQVEVLKGASSVLYGSSALNGIISVQTKWPGEKPRTDITLFPGFYSKPKRDGLNWTSDRLTNSGLRISDSRRLDKKNELNTSFEYIHDEGYRFGDHEKRLHVGADWRNRVGNDMFVGLRAHLLRTDVGSFLLWKSYDSAYLALDDAFTTTLGTKLRIDPFWTWRTKTDWFHRLNTRYLFVDNNVDNGNPDNDQSNSASTYYADYQISSPRYFGLQSTSGALFTGTVSESPIFGGTHRSQNSAIYTQLEWKHRALIVNAGVRFEDYRLDDYHESRPVFRAGVNYALTKGTFIRASYGEGYRFPTIAESFISTRVGGVSVFSNPTLRSESGHNTEVGVKQGFKNKFIKGFLDVTAFQMRYDDMMEFTFSQWSNDISFENFLGLGFKSVNTGSTQIRGVDASLNAEIDVRKQHNIKLLCGFTFSDPVSLHPDRVFALDSVGTELNYLNTSSDTTGYTLKYRSRNLIRVDVAYAYKSWQLGLSYRYQSNQANVDKKFVVEPITIFIPGIPTGIENNDPGIQVMDARLFYNFPKQIRAGIVISNLFNREFMVRPGDMGPPRRLHVQIKKTI